MDSKRLLPLSGIAFVLILVAVIAFAGDTPSSDAGGQEVFTFYDAHELRHGLGAFLLAAAAPFVVLFGVTLVSAASPGAAARRQLWERMLIGGAILTGAALAVGALVHFALVDGADQGISPTALQALNVVDNDTFLPFATGLGVMMLGACGCLIPSVGAYRWLGWLALIVGILLFIPFSDFFAILATALWIIVVSILLARERAEAMPAASPASPDA